MKKLVSIILAVMLVSALAVTSFAAVSLPTVDYVFNADGYTYVFGKTNENSDYPITDAGLCVVDINENKHFAKFSELDNEATELTKVINSGKFGFELKTNGLVNDEFLVEPTYTYNYNNSNPARPVTIKGMPHILNAVDGTVKKGVEGTPVLNSKWCSVSSYTTNTTSDNAAIARYNKLLLTFDISNISAASDKIYLELPGFASAAAGNSIHDYKYSLTVYDTEDNSEYVKGQTYNETLGSGNIIVKDKVGKVTNNDIFYTSYNGVGVPSSNYYTGLRADLTDYIKAKKADPNVKNITIVVGVDDPNDAEQYGQTGVLYFGTSTTDSRYIMKLVPVNFD